MKRASPRSAPSGRQDLREVRNETALRVQIVERSHPHFEEYGRLTGKLIQMKFGAREEMAEVALENCRHGVDGCFVHKGDIVRVNP